MASNQISYQVHSQLLYNFAIEALKNKIPEGGHNETLAYLTGHIQGGIFTSHDLVYPKQRCSSSNVDDLGRYFSSL